MVAQLVDQTKGHASVLEHVIKGKVRDRVLGRVDLGVGVLKGRLDNESGRVAGL